MAERIENQAGMVWEEYLNWIAEELTEFGYTLSEVEESGADLEALFEGSYDAEAIANMMELPGFWPNMGGNANA